MVLTKESVFLETLTFIFLLAIISLQYNTVKMHQDLGVHFFSVSSITFLQQQWYSTGVEIPKRGSPIQDLINSWQIRYSNPGEHLPLCPGCKTSFLGTSLAGCMPQLCGTGAGYCGSASHLDSFVLQESPNRKTRWLWTPAYTRGA